MPKFLPALGSAAVIVVIAALALSTLSQARPAPAATLPTSPADWSRVDIEGGGGISRIAAGRRGLVAIAGYDRIIFSADGRDWSVAEVSPVWTDWVDVVATDAGFLLLDGDGVWTSQDGLAWQRTFIWTDDPKFTDSIVADVSAGGPGYVAVGSNNRAWYSTDGAEWSLAQMPPPPAEFIRPDYPELTVDLLHVAAVGDHLVAAGYVYAGNSDTSITKDIVLVSSDGRTWSTVLPDIGDRVGPLQLAAGPNGFLVIGGPLGGGHESTVWQSADGETWQKSTTSDFSARSSDANCTPRIRMEDVAGAGTGYVAVGIEHECMNGDFPASPPHAVIWASEDGRSWSRLQDPSVFTLPDAQDSLGVAAGSVVAWGPRFVVGGMYGGAPAIWISGSGGSQTTTTPTASPTQSASPRPSPASTASRFTSTIHGISIDYPTGWQIRPASEAWGLDPVGFDATDIDIIFDPILEGDLYIGMASGLASEPLAGPPHDDWPSLQEASQLCSGGGGAGRYPVDNATSWAGYCVDADGSTNWYAFVGTATRGYFIYLHAGNEGLSATYGGERFDALLQTVDLLP